VLSSLRVAGKSDVEKWARTDDHGEPEFAGNFGVTTSKFGTWNVRQKCPANMFGGNFHVQRETIRHLFYNASLSACMRPILNLPKKKVKSYIIICNKWIVFKLTILRTISNKKYTMYAS
jgi:hypothetical protein